MDALRSLTVLLLTTVLGVVTSRGDEWTSADGVIEVTAPDAARFDRMDDPPEPFLALWISKDETLRLGVMKIAISAQTKLVRSSTEKGLAQEVRGTIAASSTMVRNGHEVWLMTAQGSNQGVNLQITQALANVNGSVYKVMAATVGDGPADDVAIDAFVNSIKIKPAASNPYSDSVAEGDGEPGDGIDLHNLSKTIGGAGALLLIILVVWMVVRQGKAKRDSST
jgi:hypothetical protein